MVEISIVELPPGPAPEQRTVGSRSTNLREHFAGFVNSNNLHGFLPDTDTPALNDHMFFVLLGKEFDVEYSTLAHIRRLARRIKNCQIGKSSITLA